MMEFLQCTAKLCQFHPILSASNNHQLILAEVSKSDLKKPCHLTYKKAPIINVYISDLVINKSHDCGAKLALYYIHFYMTALVCTQCAVQFVTFSSV